MRRILIVANTYYQMIMAMQLNNTVFKDDSVVLLLSDHSKNTETICGKLNEEHIFEGVHYIKTKGIPDRRNSVDKLTDYFQISFGRKNRYSYYLDGVQNKYFDEIICYNYGIDIIGVYSAIYWHNPNVIVSLYEEGILTYDVVPQKTIHRAIIHHSRHFFGKKSINDVLSNFYCLYPELYRGNLNPVKIPEVADSGICAETLRHVFELSADRLSYPQKYIFFTSVYDFEGGKPIGEYRLVEQVAQLVGKENLLVKIHPRDVRTIYADNGFAVDRNSEIPWEAIQLSGHFRDNVFLTATSGSVLAGSFMAENPVKTFYLYNLCKLENNSLSQNSAKNIAELLGNEKLWDILKHVHIANQIEDILK